MTTQDPAPAPVFDIRPLLADVERLKEIQAALVDVAGPGLVQARLNEREHHRVLASAHAEVGQGIAHVGSEVTATSLVFGATPGYFHVAKQPEAARPSVLGRKVGDAITVNGKDITIAYIFEPGPKPKPPEPATKTARQKRQEARRKKARRKGR